MILRKCRMVGLASIPMILFLLSGQGRSDERDTPAAARDVVFGLNPVFIGGDFTMEVNCRDPHNKKAACEPNCCILIDRNCVLRLFIVGRCRDLPGKPFIWRVRLVNGCKLTGPQKTAPKVAERKDKTGYIVEVPDDAEIEVNLGKSKK